MRRIVSVARAAYGRWRDAYDIRSARAFHRAMGHNCSFCSYGRPPR